MDKSLRDVTLDTVAGGAAAELFDREFRKVLENIADPNTKPEAKRQILIKVTFEPHGDREGATMAVEVASKLAPAKPAVGTMYLGRRNNRLVGVTSDPRQMDAFGDDEDVRPLARAAEQQA